MRFSPATAHAICLGLFALDLVARAWRIQWYLRGLGHRLSLGHALQLNAWGDAAAGLTPMRFGGEAARVAGLLRSGIPATGAFMAIGLEVLVAYPLVVLFAAVIFAQWAPDWWAHAAPTLRRSLADAWPWAVGVLGLTVAVGVVAWRWQRVARREPGRAFHRVQSYWRAMRWWPVATGVPTSLVNVGARTLMLPVLAMSLPEPPPFGVLMVGSFVLLYSQLVLPTPAGAGAVDLGFLTGVAGNLGEREASLLLAWRFYTVGAGVTLGVALALRTFGWAALRRAAKGVWRPRADGRTGGR